jgi:hypothetical protein
MALCFLHRGKKQKSFGGVGGWVRVFEITVRSIFCSSEIGGNHEYMSGVGYLMHHFTM